MPFRLSALVPFLPYLARALVGALDTTTDLFNQGVRLLELCVESLSSEALENFIEPIRSELMGALYKHAASKDRETSAVFALRQLGKLGGWHAENALPPC